MSLVSVVLAAAPAPAPADERPTVRLDTSLGAIDVRLFPEAAPNAVATFLRYVERGSYRDSYFHRSELNLLIQGGGFRFVEGESRVIDEFKADSDLRSKRSKRSERATLAVARVPGEPKRSTSQWFFNVRDNRSLDRGRDNYTVFGRIVGREGLGVIDRIAELFITDGSNGDPRSAFGALPVLPSFTGFPITPDEVVLVRSVAVAPEASGAPFELDGSAISARGSRRRVRVTVRGLPATAYVVARLGRAQDAAVARDGTARLSVRRARTRRLVVTVLPAGAAPSRATIRVR